jgi:hypothetical protein
MELNDDEITLIHSWLEDWIQSSEYWTDEDQEEKSTLFGKVVGEAKRRGFWWAR